jgi:hypothetical protein
LDEVSLGPLKDGMKEDESWGEKRERVKRLMDEAGAVPPVMEERTEDWVKVGEAAEAEGVEAQLSPSTEEEEKPLVAGTDERPQASVRTTADGWVYFSEVVAADEATFAGEIEDEVRACFAALSGVSLLSSPLSLYPPLNTLPFSDRSQKPSPPPPPPSSP